MPKEITASFLDQLSSRYGHPKLLPLSRSLFELESGARILVRYSKLHPGNRTFYGLRRTDLQELEGRSSLICFLWPGQKEPLLVPYAQFEEVFHSLEPASDGQFKAQVYPDPEGMELYIANAGRFNVEAYLGWNESNRISIEYSRNENDELTHSQVQTLLGGIGSKKGHDIWIPRSDRGHMDWNLASQFELHSSFPAGVSQLEAIIGQVDVMWLNRGSTRIAALFEVEHSTPIYSGLLRFNDLHLTWPTLNPRFGIVANTSRRSLFTRQINRPTFEMSGLSRVCSFLDYNNVFDWYQRVSKGL